jgi:protein-L-isoaspartate(D-aspartate) O-methyltransferase
VGDHGKDDPAESDAQVEPGTPIPPPPARTRLARAGFGGVTVVTGDGAGSPEHGPYDRVIATVGARQIPPAWVAQTRSGGMVLVPWDCSDWYPSALLKLDVDSGARGRGRILGGASFMKLRDQRRPRSRVSAILDQRENVTASMTDVHPWYIATEQHAATTVGLRVPDVKMRL